MVLDGVLLSPLGLLALLSAVPLLLLYLIRPDPRERDLPTTRFLRDDRGEDASSPVFERLSRNLLLFVQLAALVLLAVSLAAPYVSVSEASTVEETVIVVDGSASMATESGGTTRFARALAAADGTVTSSTSVVFVGGAGEVVARAGGPTEARAALDGLAVTDEAGDLRDGIAQAAAVAGESARIVVFSDFAGTSDWETAVETARARGLLVDLRQFAGGGADNVGIVDRTFEGTEVTVTVRNYADSKVTRTLALGDRRRELRLGSGDVTTVTLPVPTGGGTARLTPGDSFPVDDAAPIAAPADAAIDVLLLTNDRNRYLAAALSVIPEVELTEESPPANVEGAYDVVVYSNIEQGRLLQGNVEDGRAALERGGGVVVQAQEATPTRYAELLPVRVGEPAAAPAVGSVASGDLTRDITFPPPERYLPGETAEGGRTLAGFVDGSPLLAAAERNGGRVLYYGYIEDASSFKYNYQYPVFWKRALFYLADRATLSDLNRPTGEALRFDEPRAVETPDGAVTAAGVPMRDAGFYEVGERRYGAALVSETESAVAAEPLESREGSLVRAREEEQHVPDPLTEWVALAAFGVAVAELGLLRRRGDL